MKVKLFPSFSGLLMLLKHGYMWEDSSECIYMFGATKLGISETFQLYDEKDTLNHSAILEKLDKAESEGRVSWRNSPHIPATVGSSARLEWLISQLKSKGVNVGESKGRDYDDAGWNLPALTRWLSVNAPEVIVADNEFGMHW